MFRHRNCISDPVAQEMWRDFQHVTRQGNPLGLSFTEYVAARIAAQAPKTVTAAHTSSIDYYPAQCGHRHPWGESCSNWTEA